MILLAVGCNFRHTPIELRERLAFADNQLPRALGEIGVRYGCESLILSTCNRVEVYLARLGDPRPAGSNPGSAAFDAELIAEFLGEWHKLPAATILPHLYERREGDAVRHLFRVAASLDSLIVGEGQIAGQVKQAYDLAQQQGSVGAILHALFQHARVVAKRVRTETGIAHGHVSISSAAVDYVQQVFEHFDDKTILVIGAGKMGELTLKHLKELKPRAILVTNRSFDKAIAVARGCGGQALPWEQLDDALAQAHIVLSTTGAPDVIVTEARWRKVQAKRTKGPVVILDIAVPRDFDPAIHDGESTCLFNIDDLQRIKEKTLQQRQKHIAPAEAIIEHEAKRFLKDWQRRRIGPVIARLEQEYEAKRQVIVQQLMARLNGATTDADRKEIEGAFRLYKNQLLHVPISALNEDAAEGGGSGLVEALRKLFRLHD